MLNRYRDSSLFNQLLIPMLAIGIIGVGAIILSAIALKDSVDALGEMYAASSYRLKTLQDVDKDIAVLRTLSFRHQANESAEMMNRISEEIDATKLRLNKALPTILENEAGSHQEAIQGTNELVKALTLYFADIDQMIRLSNDFEKENAFSLLRRTENENQVFIQEAIQKLTRHAFEDISASRADLVAVTNHNLRITVATGILGGIILLGVAFYVSRRASKRINNLVTWSKRIAAEDLSKAPHVDGQDEFGQLTQAMLGMVDNLIRGRDALERAKKNAEATAEELRLYANAFESSGEAIMITDSANRIINVNTTFTAQTGYSLDEVRGKDPKLLSSGNTPQSVYEAMWECLHNDGFWQGELWDRSKSGEIYPKWISISAIRDEHREIIFYIASFSDISERKANEKRIDYLAHHDALTGLINRYNLENRLGQAVLAAQRENHAVGVMFIDMDRFKTINDTLGHHVGDLLLIEVARRLRSSMRESDIVARLGGDEFVVVLTGMTSSLDAPPVAEKILRKLGEPYRIEHHQLHSSPSIGIAIYPEDGNDGQTLMKNADTAMYHAKDRGRNNIQYFTAAMNDAASERLSLEQDLREALRHRQFELNYQPQIHAASGCCYGVEALLRWRHPQRGYIAPLKFIHIAEESGLIEELGQWVLDEACRQISAWRSAGIDGVRVAVNISPRQLRNKNLVVSISSLLRKHGLSGEDLELEITESAAMDNPNRAIIQLQALRNLGVQLAIDDFGTGYSSLAYLKRLPIQILKLDRTFVRDIESGANDAAISAATLALAHNLGLKVVAEGVETEAQRNFLMRHDCDYLQGYLFSPPLPGQEITQYLMESGTSQKHQNALA